MTPEMLDEAVVLLAILAGYLFLLGAGGIIADYVLPRVPFLRRWMETLPMWDEDENEEGL